MSDEDLATRAPESDLAAESMIPGDTVVDQGGASMGAHCTSDRPSPPGANPTGEFTHFGTTEAYITKPADYPHSPSKLLLLLPSGTGIHSTNNRLQADAFASHGYLVVMPDQFAGDPAPSAADRVVANPAQHGSTSAAAAAAAPSWIERIKLGVAETAKSFSIDMWLARHTPETVLPRLRSVLAHIRDEYADAVANGGGVYCVGYCFGGKYVLLLASEMGAQTEEGKREVGAAEEEGVAGSGGPAIKCGVLAHGTMVDPSDFAAVKVPVGIVAVQEDALFPDEVREDGVKKIKAQGGEVEQWVYPGVPHGFAVVGDYEDATIKQAQKQAFDVMLGWLQAH